MYYITGMTGLTASINFTYTATLDNHCNSLYYVNDYDFVMRCRAYKYIPV